VSASVRRATMAERTVMSLRTKPPLLVGPLGRATDTLLICAIGSRSRLFACGKKSMFIDWV
jgi:hypothetical protein